MVLQQNKCGVTKTSAKIKSSAESKNPEETKDKSNPRLDQHLVQIRADKSEVKYNLNYLAPY